MTKQIWFDMDGTIADFYGVENWLDYLLQNDPTPYALAKPLFNFSVFARYLHKAQARGWQIGIVSWGSKSGDADFLEAVRAVKLAWLAQHLPSVQWDEIKVIAYGTNKYTICGGGILFDDEARNRDSWEDEAHDPADILEILKALTAEA